MNTKKTTRLSMVALAAFLASGPIAVAHHGDAGRYEETLTTVTGAVVEVQFVNPHSILIFDVTDAQGQTARWRGELGSPTQLRRSGWGTTTVRPGDTITVRGRRLKSGSPYMTLSECARVIDASGKEVFRGNDPAPPPGQAAPEGDPCAGPIK
jgi:hypothetical protein